MQPNQDAETLRRALLELTPAQQTAVEAIVGGLTHREAAEAASVTRETVTRWSGHVPAFRAALNLYRSIVQAEHFDIACRIRGKALSALEHALDAGEVDPASVLRVVGNVQFVVGPTVPEAILDQEINRTRSSLPPLPPLPGIDGLLESVHGRSQSDEERAEITTMSRLVNAGGIAS